MRGKREGEKIKEKTKEREKDRGVKDSKRMEDLR